MFTWKSGKRKSENMNENLPLAGAFARWPQRSRVGQAEAQAFIQVSNMGSRDLNTGAIFCHFAQDMSRELDCQQSSWDMQ